MRRVAIVMLAGLLATPFASAGMAQLSGGPTTAPAAEESEEVDSLVKQLGDADFHVRRNASNRLLEMGIPALPALKQAADNTNPEVRSRAAQLVRTLEYRHVPGRPLRQHRTRVRSSSMRIINGQRTVDVNDEGRQIHIVETGDDIVMTVIGETDGHPATETYRAESADRLEAENPEAFALYDRWSRKGGIDGDTGVFQGNIAVQGQGNLVVQPLPFIRVGDEVGVLRDRVERGMQNANIPEAKKQQVQHAIDKVSRLMNFSAAAGGQDDGRIADYDNACDELRKMLHDLNLPDPGDALPPPQGARLGISVAPDGFGAGLAVYHVVPESRADRIGLQNDDVIRKINGKDIDDVKQLRRLVTEHSKGLVLDITRDGREMKLQEKDEPATK